MDSSLLEILDKFSIPQVRCMSHIREIKAGHINKTYHIQYPRGDEERNGREGRQKREDNEEREKNIEALSSINEYILQKINRNVFKDPVGLMQNMKLVCDHLQSKDIVTLTLIPLKKRKQSEDGICDSESQGQGLYYYVDGDGSFWRVCIYLKNSRIAEDPPSEQDVFVAAKEFGNFQAQLSDLFPSLLRTTIPDFHNTRLRFDSLVRLILNDPLSLNRIEQYSLDSLVEMITSREYLSDVIWSLHERSNIPQRIVHNDPKLSNVLIDEITGHSLCVIDLDTVMTGSLLYDFGDMVRSSCSSLAKDDPNVEILKVDLKQFHSIVFGYLSSEICFPRSSSLFPSNCSLLSDAERNNLVRAAQVVSFEQAIRFFSDFLAGDIYYSTESNRNGRHNLDRTLNQIHFLLQLEQNEQKMNEIVDQVWNQLKIDQFSSCKYIAPPEST